MLTGPTTTPLRVVLADDAVFIREAIGRVLCQEGMEVTAEVGDPFGLRDAVAADRPDLAVVDIRMPPTFELEGLHAAVELRRTHPNIGMLLLSQHLESRHLRTLLGANASGAGYLLKRESRQRGELRRGRTPGRSGWMRGRPRGGVTHAQSSVPTSGVAHVTGTGRTHVDGRRALEPGDLRTTVPHGEDGGVPRPQHLPPTQPADSAGRSSSGSRRPRVPERGDNPRPYG